MTEPAVPPRSGTMDPGNWGLRARAGLAAASGLLLTVAFPPLDLWWVAPFAFAGLTLALHRLPGRRAALAGAAFGVTFVGALVYWLWISAGVLAWVALTLLQAVFFAAIGWAWARASRLPLPARLGLLPFTFVALEIARARMPVGGFTWGGAGMTQVGSPLDGFAPYGGVHLVSVVVVLIGVAIAEIAMRPPRLVALAPVVIVAPLLGVILPGVHGNEAGRMDVAAVQGDVPRHSFTIGRGREGPEDEVIVRNHLEATATLLGSLPPDLVVWPENSFDRDPRDHPELFEPTIDLIRRVNAPFIIGAILDSEDGYTNSNLHISPDGTIIGRYDKLHLVPFGEYVPAQIFRDLVPILNQEIPTDGIPGDQVIVFDMGGRKVGSVICFESTYPSLVRRFADEGAEIIVVTTNNASFGTTPAAAQHLAQSRMRAIENGRAVVHTAISGISALISPTGRVLERTQLFEQEVLRAELPLHRGRTPYTRYGPWLEVAFLVAGAAAVVAPLIVRERS